MSQEREALIAKVIGLSVDILIKEGHESLTVRRIAHDSGASTQLIYTLFGGKFGLIDGLYREGFRRLREVFNSSQGPDARTKMKNAISNYRKFALENRGFYTMMFSRPVSEYNPPKESLEDAWASFNSLVELALACQRDGCLEKMDPKTQVRMLWASMHGVVSLELIGHFKDGSAPAVFQQITDRFFI